MYTNLPVIISILVGIVSFASFIYLMMRNFNSDITKKISDLKTDIKDVKDDLNQNMKDFKDDINQKIKDVKDDIKYVKDDINQKIKDVKDDIKYVKNDVTSIRNMFIEKLFADNKKANMPTPITQLRDIKKEAISATLEELKEM